VHLPRSRPNTETITRKLISHFASARLIDWDHAKAGWTVKLNRNGTTNLFSKLWFCKFPSTPVFFFILQRIILLAAEEAVPRYVPRGSPAHSTRATFYFTTSHSAQKATRADKQRLKDDLPVSVPQAQTEAILAPSQIPDLPFWKGAASILKSSTSTFFGPIFMMTDGAVVVLRVVLFSKISLGFQTFLSSSTSTSPFSSGSRISGSSRSSVAPQSSSTLDDWRSSRKARGSSLVPFAKSLPFRDNSGGLDRKVLVTWTSVAGVVVAAFMGGV